MVLGGPPLTRRRALARRACSLGPSGVDRCRKSYNTGRSDHLPIVQVMLEKVHEREKRVGSASARAKVGNDFIEQPLSR